ncbi:MAG TPA: c-type cytochrome [Eoetvoesiella sp.]
MRSEKSRNDNAMPKLTRYTLRFASPASVLLGMAALFLLIGCGEERPALSPRSEAYQLKGADPGRGRQLISNYGCVACHAVPGVRGPTSRIGPPLDKIALRAYVGGVLPNSPANLVRWLLDPPAIDPRTAMPNMGLNEADAKDIAAYLLALP